MAISVSRPEVGGEGGPFLVSPPQAERLRYSSVAIIFVLWGAIYFAGMFTPALLDDVDTIHAEAAREMVLRHDWVTLYTDGIRYLEKAPLMYWGVAASYEIFGVNDWSTRLPLMLGVLALLLVTYFLGRHAYSERGGLYASVVLATSLGPYIFTRFQIPDIAVGLWLALSAYFFLLSLEQEQPTRWVCWGFAATCALNVLTKSLIGLLFPLGSIFLYLLLTRNLRHILKLRLVSSALVFLAIAAPWHILAALRNPSQGAVKGFLWFYFVNEQFMRYLGKRVPAGYDTVPLLIFWGLTILWLAPWMVFLPQSLKQVPRRVRELHSQLTRSQRASLLFAIWALVTVGFFTFSTRQEYYTIPAVPALALLVGAWLDREAGAPATEGKAGKISSWILFAAVVAGSAIGLALLVSSKTPVPGADLADLLRKNPQDYDFSLGHFLDLTPEALGMFRPQLIGAIASLLVGTGVNLWMRYRRRPQYGNAVLVLMMVGLLTCVHAAFGTFSPILSSKRLALAIKPHYQPGDVVLIDGQYHQASTLNFYLETRVRVLHEPSGNLWYGSKFPDAPHVFETPASFAQLWNAPVTVFMWTDQDRPKELAGLPHYLLARSGGKSIFVNRELRAGP
ncbi:MAG TPA: glycosyltransferase family 39 protein [Terriglobales bacterium]|nr:glycosyltransferase family 39 protein [Terriglobales bacterium]